MCLEKYDHKKIEAKWQKEWEKEGIYKTPEAPGDRKKYVLDMFPYPSGATMHVGHLEGYIGTDIFSRYLRMNGQAVLHPMGWDSFGLPAENYAIKTGIHPDKSIHRNIEVFKRQLMNSGLSYDWSREIDTGEPEFYRWTQWLFILMFKKGLAYKKKAPVNWCPSCKTVLANEQVVDGKCERCDTEVVKKELEQWFFKITKYADRLISGLDKIDWPEDVKTQQKNWIGKSEGMIIRFKIYGAVASSAYDLGFKNNQKELEVFTTRPDTLESATFIATSKLYEDEQGPHFAEASRGKEKLGKFTGEYAINPINSRKLPVWETNYVEENYGTGVIMGVPAYDERDMEFAKKYDIDIVTEELNDDLWERIEKEGWGKKDIKYHLRDWLVSRQRYWGAPIPMIYCRDCGWNPVNDTDLPVLLPKDVDFLPHGESPIARSKTFQKGVKCPKCGKSAKREVDTMDTYVDSSWYFIRFVDPKNNGQFAGAKKIKEWLPVDYYVGGGHVVQHLLFARFFWKVLFDEGLIDKTLGDEPFLKLRAPGWILGPDFRKMSKRWDNIVTPDEIIPKFGADTLRLYEMFMGPFEVIKPWNITGIEGMKRFTNRLWKLFVEGKSLEEKNEREVSIKLHQTIKKVTEDIQVFKYNTAIAAIMELINLLYDKGLDDKVKKNLVLLLAPFVPHMAEEVWIEVLNQPFSVHTSAWPKYDPKYLQVEEVAIAVQVDGRFRAQIQLNAKNSKLKKEVEKMAKDDQKVSKYILGRQIKKTVFVEGKLINFVTNNGES